MMSIKRYRLEVLCVIGCLLLSNIVGYTFMSRPLDQWYLLLVKPSYNPPSYVFGPVWTLLYISMGVALGSLLKEKEKHFELIVLFCAQFLLNIIWTPLFFWFRRIDLALLDLTVLWLLVLILIYRAKDIKKVALLLLPYFLWLSFAWFLNLNIFFLNA